MVLSKGHIPSAVSERFERELDILVAKDDLV